MRKLIIIIVCAVTFISAHAYRYSYTFRNTPISEAVLRISKDNPDTDISFIYKDLDSYKTSADIHTDDTYEALRMTIGLNPVNVIEKDNKFYVEALQHGKFRYTGRAIGSDNEPVAAATVMLLSSKDSTVITYGFTDNNGRFSIPCDKSEVIGKFSCIGYRTTFKYFSSFSVGTVIMLQNAIALSEVKVDADNAFLYSDKSVYVPTAKQKNSSQTALDLINRMAIPQLGMGDKIETNARQPVEIYIDFIPATSAELTGMLVSDVKKVEYYDYPADPRFQGNPHVINFIMQKYEYGGYVKGIYYDNFITSRQLNSFAKIQYKNMTFDWAGGIYYKNDRRDYENTVESFRMPQEDGTVREFTRSTSVDNSVKRNNDYWSSFKALYRTDNISLSNMISGDFNYEPKKLSAGSVTYHPSDYLSSDYFSNRSSRANSLVYNGYWYFRLPGDNSITFNPYYAYTHTRQTSVYDETGFNMVENGAVDDSHQATCELSFTHSFGKAGTLKAMCSSHFLQNKTSYSGTSSLSDKARTYRLGPGIGYNISLDKIYCNLQAGLYWDKSEYGKTSEKSMAPWVNLATQYAFNTKNSLSADFSYRKSIPASSYRSASVIQDNPFMSYTGNPGLVPYNSIEVEGNYTFIPDKKYSLAAYGFIWIVDNRYVYDYEAYPDGILRTIKQPMGSYAQWQYGIKASTKQFDRNLSISCKIFLEQAHNGTPYNWTKSKPAASLSAYYYLDNIYFGTSYSTHMGYPDGCMVGTWMQVRSSYSFQVGWNNKNWKLRLFTRNFLRHDTYQIKGVMNSRYYDSVRYIYNYSYAGFFQISATYSFSFGKKVKDNNEAYQATGASTGILK